MKLQMILEKENGSLWGRVSYNKELFVDSAATLPVLEKKLKKVLQNFHELDSIEFEYAYDLTVFFETFNFLNQSKIAALSGINPGLLRQYASGVKHPSREQANKIQSAIRELAGKLRSVKISA
jgi:hypothetical protein